MTRDEARVILERGELLEYWCWHFGKNYSNCGDGCCDTDFNNVEEALDLIEFYSGGKWEEVREL